MRLIRGLIGPSINGEARINHVKFRHNRAKRARSAADFTDEGPRGYRKPPSPDAHGPPWLEVEPGARHLLRYPGAVQIGRDPAEMERPPRAQDHAQVDVLGRGHHAVVEHQPD